MVAMVDVGTQSSAHIITIEQSNAGDDGITIYERHITCVLIVVSKIKIWYPITLSAAGSATRRFALNVGCYRIASSIQRTSVSGDKQETRKKNHCVEWPLNGGNARRIAYGKKKGIEFPFLVTCERLVRSLREVRH
ncbi:hypothetical protein AVEN_105791-1 [Araneus ventricosus]|uniref:Uncharacterized protein n=1 Tax=Araneus ventricosus TaxID=182803 RepID=A0A4Y2W4X0_ARAVE|nr:hypothetical protein AVEN_193057-1 [Araneus ventricosus]GBO31578.1 hypothetical protein AVEN_105791-1 [Araneus ventricosus]